MLKFFEFTIVFIRRTFYFFFFWCDTLNDEESQVKRWNKFLRETIWTFGFFFFLLCTFFTPINLLIQNTLNSNRKKKDRNNNNNWLWSFFIFCVSIALLLYCLCKIYVFFLFYTNCKFFRCVAKRTAKLRKSNCYK